MNPQLSLRKLLIPAIVLLQFCTNTVHNTHAIAATEVASLELVGEFEIDGWSFDIKVENNYAYLSDYNNGLQIIDISSKSEPTLAGFCNLSKCHNLDVSSGFAYVSCWEYGIQIVNITNPNDPYVAAIFATDARYGHVQVEGLIAYASGINSALEILDVTDPTDPILVGEYQIINRYSNVFHVVDRVAYLSTYDNTSSTGIELVDVSDSSSPEFISSYDEGEETYGIFVQDRICYLANWNAGLEILSITDETSAISLSHFYDGGNADTIVAKDDLVYLADLYGGFEVIDTFDLFNPVKIAGFDGIISGVAIDDEYIYIIDRVFGLKILKLNFSTQEVRVPIFSIMVVVFFFWIKKQFLHHKTKAKSFLSKKIN